MCNQCGWTLGKGAHSKKVDERGRLEVRALLRYCTSCSSVLWVVSFCRRYGGNPVCSAAGRAVLRVVDAEKRQAHCHEVRTTG